MFNVFKVGNFNILNYFSLVKNLHIINFPFSGSQKTLSLIFSCFLLKHKH